MIIDYRNQKAVLTSRLPLEDGVIVGVKSAPKYEIDCLAVATIVLSCTLTGFVNVSGLDLEIPLLNLSKYTCDGCCAASTGSLHRNRSPACTPITNSPDDCSSETCSTTSTILVFGCTSYPNVMDFIQRSLKELTG